MKTSPYILFLLSFYVLAVTQNWELVLQDEFAGSSLNEQKWVHEIGTGFKMVYGDGEMENYNTTNQKILQ